MIYAMISSNKEIISNKESNILENNKIKIINSGNKFRILFLISDLDVGGCELFLKDLCSGLYKHFNIKLINFSKETKISKEINNLKNIEVINLNYSKNEFIKNLFRIRKFIIKTIHEFKPIIVQSFLFFDNQVLRTIQLRKGIKRKFIKITSRRNNKPISFVRKIIEKILSNEDYIITNSQSAANEIKKINKKVRIKVIYNGKKIIKDETKIKEAKDTINKELKRRGLSNLDELFVVGNVSNHRKVKRLDLLFKAFIKFNNKNKKSILIQIGDYNLDNYNEKERKTYFNNKNILILGSKNSINYYDLFDVFVLTSENEGFPNVLLEAMAFNKPIIAFCVGGIKELFYNSKHNIGFCLKDEDYKKNINNIVKKLTYIKENKENQKEQWESLCEFNDKYNFKRMIKDYYDFYLKIIKIFKSKEVSNKIRKVKKIKKISKALSNKISQKKVKKQKF